MKKTLEEYVAKFRSTSFEDRDWAAGLIDGDGSVGICTDGSLRVHVCCAEPSWSALDRLEHLFGGSVTVKHDTIPEVNPRYNHIMANWQLGCGPAAEFCKIMLPHVILKRPQFLDASRWLETKAPSEEPLITLKREGQEDWTGSRAELCKHLDICMHHLWYLRKKKTPDGWCFSEWKRPTADKAARMKMKQRLEELKRIPHDRVERDLSVAYAAGFVDSDGCLALHPSGSLMLAVYQKYPAITDTFKRQFGGYTRCCNGQCRWDAAASNRSDVIRSMLPYLQTDKRKRAELLLARTRANAKQIDWELDMLKKSRRFL